MPLTQIRGLLPDLHLLLHSHAPEGRKNAKDVNMQYKTLGLNCIVAGSLGQKIP